MKGGSLKRSLEMSYPSLEMTIAKACGLDVATRLHRKYESLLLGIYMI